MLPEEIGELRHNILWHVLGGQKDHVSADVEKAQLKTADTVRLCSDGQNAPMPIDCKQVPSPTNEGGGRSARGRISPIRLRFTPISRANLWEPNNGDFKYSSSAHIVFRPGAETKTRE